MNYKGSIWRERFPIRSFLLHCDFVYLVSLTFLDFLMNGVLKTTPRLDDLNNWVM